MNIPKLAVIFLVLTLYYLNDVNSEDNALLKKVKNLFSKWDEKQKEMQPDKWYYKDNGVCCEDEFEAGVGDEENEEVTEAEFSTEGDTVICKNMVCGYERTRTFTCCEGYTRNNADECVEEPGQDNNNGPPQNNGGPPQNNGSPPQNNGGPPQNNDGPPKNNDGPPQNNGGPPQNNNGPPQSNGGPPQNNGGPPQNNNAPKQAMNK